MRNPNRIIAVAIAITSASALAVLGTGCAGSKDAPMKALRAEANDLNQQLADTQRALRLSEEEKTGLQTTNQELHEELASLQREQRQQLGALQSLRDDDAATAAKRMRELNNRIDVLRGEIAQKDALNARKDDELTQRSQLINTLNSSIDAHRSQIASLEKERTALAEELKTAKRNRSRGMLVMGLLVVGSVAAGYFSRSARARRGHESEMLLRMHTADNRKIS